MHCSRVDDILPENQHPKLGTRKSTTAVQIDSWMHMCIQIHTLIYTCIYIYIESSIYEDTFRYTYKDKYKYECNYV